MGIVHRQYVYNGFLLDPAAGVTLPSTPSGYVSVLGPRIPARWCQDTTWQVMVEDVEGSPTTAVLKARFQAWFPMWGIHSQDTILVSEEPRWMDVNADEHPEIVDKPFPVQLADETLGATPTQPLMYLARIRGGFYHRVVFDLAVTGGTSPKIKVSAEYTQRG